jgi:hypothetical protein
VVVSLGAVVGALRDVEVVRDVVMSLSCREAMGADFLMSLCDLRIGADSFDVETVLVIVRSET